MGIKNVFSKFKKNNNTNKNYAAMLNGSIPIFHQFGSDIYKSDIIDRCTSIKAREMGKLRPKHIRKIGEKQTTINSSINQLLKFSPNIFMTTSDFLNKCTWLYEKNYNCFIYPEYRQIKVKNGTIREYTGLYPLNPASVELLEDKSGTYYIKFQFENGYAYTMKYADIIHWRKDFSTHEFMGGDENGESKDNLILNTIKTEKTITEGLEKAVKSSLAIRGVIKINTLLDDEKQQKERAAFEKKLKSSNSGIVPLDLKSDYIQISTDPKIIDKDTLSFIREKILSFTGVSYPLYSGNFTDTEYQAFYESELENKIISLGQAFSKCIFTKAELEMGNEIIFYGQKLLFTNTANKIAVADILGNRGALTDNQLLELFGYPPYDGGDNRKQSLNFVNSKIADQYQLKKGGDKNER